MKKIIAYIVGALVLLIIALGVIMNYQKKDNNLIKVRLAEVAHTVFYAPQYVALANNYFKDEGLDVELMLTPGADKVTAAVLSNDADIGFSGSEATIYVYKRGEKDYLKTFAALTKKDGSFIVSRNKINNFTLNDLKGKKIISGRLGGMPQMTFEWALKEHGINPKTDVNQDTSISFAAMSGSFIGGNGDFVNLFEPNALNLEKEGFGYVVASLGELGGVVPYTSYSARSSFINENKNVIEKFTKAIQKGLDYVHSHTDEEVANVILKEFPDTSINDLTKVVARYRQIEAWPRTTTLTKTAFDHLQDIMIASNELDTKVEFNDLVFQND
ncbi:MAG: ABC transporter substrate-binding protein [Bacilli bacterium]